MSDDPVVNRGRKGTSPAELRALWRVLYSLGALQPSLVVQLGLWPEKLAEWARAKRLDASCVYNSLTGNRRYADIRQAISDRLSIEAKDLDALIDRSAAETSHDLPPVPEGLGILVEMAQTGELEVWLRELAAQREALATAD